MSHFVDESTKHTFSLSFASFFAYDSCVPFTFEFLLFSLLSHIAFADIKIKYQKHHVTEQLTAKIYNNYQEKEKIRNFDRLLMTKSCK